MKRKFLLIFSTIVILACLLALSVSAMSGSGTETDPYIVKTAEDLISVKDKPSAYYKLDADISASSNTGAIVDATFTGVFDGNGHTVTVNIDAPTNINSDTLEGVFATLAGNGVIKNLTVRGSVSGTNKVAGIVGKVCDSAVVDGGVNYATVYGRKNVGGIAGVIFNSGAVKNSINCGAISGKSINKGVDMGGIVGCTWYVNSGSKPVINCYNAGTVTGEGANCGGIIGYALEGSILNSFNYGEITSTESSCGSFIGKSESGKIHTITGMSFVDIDIIGERGGTVSITEAAPFLESAGVSIYLGDGSGIRGEFHFYKKCYDILKDIIGSDIEYGTIISTKDVVAELNGDLMSEEAQNNSKVVVAPAMKNGEILYSFVDENKGENYHSYRFALTNFPDTKQSYNMEFVIVGYLKITDKDGNTYIQYANTVKSVDLASNVEGTDLNAVNILRVAEVTLKDGDFNNNQEALDVLNHIVSLKAYNNRIEIDGITDYGHANATFTSHISSGDTVVVEINNTDNGELSSYIDDLVANGYVKTFENEINGLYFYTYTKDNALIHISYYPSTSEVNISSETVTALPDNLTEPAYEKKNDSTITQIQLADNVSIKEGMSYVFHLADGTFFIVDGGWCYDDCLEADKLYDTLVKLAGEGNEIVISGWIFTHCHGDHIGTFNYFVEKYHDKVTINQLLYNFPSEADIQNSGSSYMLDNSKPRYTYFKEMIATYLKDTDVVKVHSGYKFYYANAEIEILQTFEDLYPSNPSSYDFNSTSTLFTVKLEGQKTMFLGDASDVAASRLTKMYGDSLKCDFMQVAHHGINSSGTIKALYQKINAEYILYPACKDWYRSNINNDANYYLEYSDTVKQIFVSGYQTVEIKLPYDGTLFDGARVPMPEKKNEVDRPSETIKVPDAYFDLDLSNGTATDSKNNASITVSNGEIKETTVIHNGEEKTATAFTTTGGGNDYMKVNFNNITTDSQWGEFVMGSSTFEIFLKLDNLPGNTVGLITSCNGGGTTLYLRKQAGGQLNFQIGSTKPNSNSVGNYSAAADMNGSLPIAEADKLLHIVGSYDKATNMMKLYINGILVASEDYGEGSFLGGQGSDYVIGIGYNPQYNGECLSSYADYELYEAKIYNVALSEEQVAQEYWNCIDNLLVTEAENE